MNATLNSKAPLKPFAMTLALDLRDSERNSIPSNQHVQTVVKRIMEMNYSIPVGAHIVIRVGKEHPGFYINESSLNEWITLRQRFVVSIEATDVTAARQWHDALQSLGTHVQQNVN